MPSQFHPPAAQDAGRTIEALRRFEVRLLNWRDSAEKDPDEWRRLVADRRDLEPRLERLARRRKFFSKTTVGEQRALLDCNLVPACVAGAPNKHPFVTKKFPTSSFKGGEKVDVKPVVRRGETDW